MSHNPDPYTNFIKAIRELRDLLKDLIAHVTVSLHMHQRRRLKEALLTLRFLPDEMLEMLHSFLVTNEPADLEQAERDLAANYAAIDRALNVIKDISRIVGVKTQAQSNKLIEIANIIKKGLRHDNHMILALSDYHPKRSESVQILIARIDEFNEIVNALHDDVAKLGADPETDDE